MKKTTVQSIVFKMALSLSFFGLATAVTAAISNVPAKQSSALAKLKSAGRVEILVAGNGQWTTK